MGISAEEIPGDSKGIAAAARTISRTLVVPQFQFSKTGRLISYQLFRRSAHQMAPSRRHTVGEFGAFLGSLATETDSASLGGKHRCGSQGEISHAGCIRRGTGWFPSRGHPLPSTRLLVTLSSHPRLKAVAQRHRYSQS